MESYHLRLNLPAFKILHKSYGGIGRVQVSWSLILLAMAMLSYISSVEATARSLIRNNKVNKFDKGLEKWHGEIETSYGEMTAGGFGGGSYNREELDKGLQSWRDKETSYEALTVGGYGGGSGGSGGFGGNGGGSGYGSGGGYGGVNGGELGVGPGYPGMGGGGIDQGKNEMKN